MCGFAAVVSTGGRVTAEQMVRMRDTLVHRGPDEAGIWVGPGGRVGFGHRRLSIIDLRHGQQPMASADGSVVINYNGEIYNHAALRTELEHAGARFATRCDTEVLLAAYEHFGEGCVERLDGMFAFTLWDTRRERLFFARDRLGKKPLYFTETRDGWAFASEAKALLAHPDVGRSVDTTALAHYLSFLATPAPSTMFAGISKVPAAHLGTWSEHEGLRLRRWWDLPDPSERLDVTPEEAAEQVLELFSAAVEKRMMSDVPFGVYLSGGVDSSANVALMSRASEEPVQTFSVAFADEPSLDELGHAREVARLFGTDHHEIVVDDAMVMRSLPALVHHQDEPIGDPVCVPLLHLARLTKERGVTVVQIGEGSDEIFRGYPVYSQVFPRTEQLRRARRIVPAPLLAAAVRLGGSRLNELTQEFMLEAIRRGVPPAHGTAGVSEREKRRLLRRNGYVTGHEYLRGLVGSGRTVDEVSDVSLRHELRLRLPELLLMRVDKMTMAASVEGRAPFLDHHLVELAARLPLHLHWSQSGGKLVLKRALAGIVPESVLRRRKQGFGAPVWRWQGSLRRIAERELFRAPVLDLFDRAALRQLLDRPATTRHGFELWVLLNFALWHRHWIEGDDLRDDEGLQRAALEADGGDRPMSAGLST